MGRSGRQVRQVSYDSVLLMVDQMPTRVTPTTRRRKYDVSWVVS